MTLQISPIQGADLGGLRILLFGDTNVGKTHFAASIADDPAYHKVLVADVDRGLQTLAYRNDVDRLEVTRVAQLDDLSKQMIVNPTHKTIILDSMTAFYELDLEEIRAREARSVARRNVDGQELQDYNEMTSRMMRIIRQFAAGGRHLIMTAGIRDIGATEANPDFWTKRRPRLNQRLYEDLSYKLDMMWYISKRSDGAIMLVTQDVTAPHGGTIKAKTRNAKFNEYLLSLGKDGNIQIGHVKQPGNYPTLADLINTYQQEFA